MLSRTSGRHASARDGYLEVSRGGGQWQLETVGRSPLDPDLDANATSGTALPLSDWRPGDGAEALAVWQSGQTCQTALERRSDRQPVRKETCRRFAQAGLEPQRLSPRMTSAGSGDQQRPDPIARDRCQRLSDESWTTG